MHGYGAADDDILARIEVLMGMDRLGFGMVFPDLGCKNVKGERIDGDLAWSSMAD